MQFRGRNSGGWVTDRLLHFSINRNDGNVADTMGIDTGLFEVVREVV